MTLYSRLHNTLLRVTTSQPVAPNDLLELLYRSIEASIDTSIASLQDIQRNWN